MSQRADFERDGLTLFSQTIGARALQRLRIFAGISERAGERLDSEALAPIVDLIGHKGAVGQVAASLSDARPFAVRAILFDKAHGKNWSLGWHQDRTINVAERVEMVGFGPWTVKHGMLHVQPPQAVIDGLVTIRVHLDDVAEDNGPLRVLLGSHRLGRLNGGEIASLSSRLETYECLATSGDVWAYRTAIVHSSGAVAEGNSGRRVLQLDYAFEPLPPPMRWAMTV